MSAALFAADVKGPEIDWMAISPLVALIGGACLVLMVGLLRAFIRTMHNRVGERVSTREIGLGDSLVLVPLVLVILALALYPQFGLARSERTVLTSILPARIAEGSAAAVGSAGDVAGSGSVARGASP